MANALFMTVRRGSTLRVIEQADDASSIAATPTAWLVLANDRGDAPEPGAPHISLTATADGDRWILTLLDTSGLSNDKYLYYSRYVMLDTTVYIPEPTPVVVKP
jgi:hypothetical protein